MTGTTPPYDPDVGWRGRDELDLILRRIVFQKSKKVSVQYIPPRQTPTILHYIRPRIVIYDLFSRKILYFVFCMYLFNYYIYI